MYGVTLLFKSDGVVRPRRAGIEDECGNGCLLVDEIRVPFPDCKAHNMYGSIVV